MKILVIIAHPDDEAIMCAGTLDKLITKGHQVSVCYLTQNDQAYFGEETQKKRKNRAIHEAMDTARYLGYHINFIKLKDMQLQKDKGLLIQKIIQEIRRAKPDAIITHHQDDKHIDHRTLGEIVPEANFQSGCKLCGGNETWQASLILQGEIDLEMTSIFNFHVVSSYSLKNLKKKIEAFKFYKSVKAEHNMEVKWLYNKIRYVAELRGKAAGSHFGEAFIINNYQPLNHKSIKILYSILTP